MSKAVDLGLVTIGIIASIWVSLTTIGYTARGWVWGVTVAFYFLFYRRMALVLYWAHDTYKYLRPLQQKSPHSMMPEPDSSPLPTFHILIAAYKAPHSIGPVLRAIANQDYPSDHVCTWVITERRERLQVEEGIRQIVERVLSPDEFLTPELLPFSWRCESKCIEGLSAWLQHLRSGTLTPLLSQRGVAPALLCELLSRWVDAGANQESKGAILQGLGLQNEQADRLEKAVLEILSKTDRLLNDFDRILGKPGVYNRKDLQNYFVQEVGQSVALRELAQHICSRFGAGVSRPKPPEREQAEIVVRDVFRSTQNAVEQLMQELPDSRIYHIDPHERGAKPGALNAAYRVIKEKAILTSHLHTYFLVIDADSLMPSHALAQIYRQVWSQDQPSSIMQLAAIPTANFFSGSWFSKFISFADAIGAVGKWARSTRKQIKPDLHAGSGVVIPAAVLQFIDSTCGQPWDESTLTEDARLIVGQYGMMDTVKNKTRAVEAYLLEAVPEGEDFRDTYRSFWNQRRRWAVGGYDECLNIVRSSSSVRESFFDPKPGAWKTYSPRLEDRCKGRVRQCLRLLHWCWDHFMWGIGGFIILTHWWLISFLIATPSRSIALLGFIALLLTPAIFLFIPGRQLSWFIPGGLSPRNAVFLYVQGFIAIWLYCLPTVITQLRCIVGFRSRILDWKPTQKPRYELESIISIEEALASRSGIPRAGSESEGAGNL